MRFDYEKLTEKLKFYFDNELNVLLVGDKGVGKTSVITEVFKDKCKEGKWLYFSGATLDPWVDFVGVPKEKTENGKTFLDFVLPKHFVDNDIEAIFIDEFNRSSKKVRNACMELIQFKSINGRHFPKLKCVWAGINPEHDDLDAEEIYDVEPMDPAQKDRFQIQIEIPYQPDLKYFSNKFGQDWAKVAIEWWGKLNEKTKPLVSPRRLDYALDLHKIGGDVFDILPLDSNPAKLASMLVVGSIEDKLKEFFEKEDRENAREFLKNENNYSSSTEYLLKNKEYLRFFTPLLHEEKLTALFFAEKKAQDFILRQPIWFKDCLEQIQKADTCDAGIKSRINKALENAKHIEVFLED
jgi:hypothetical protein